MTPIEKLTRACYFQIALETMPLPTLIVIVCRFFQEEVSVTESDKPNVLVRNFSKYCSILERSLQSGKALNIVQYILSNIIVYNINMCISVLLCPGSL